MKAYFTACLYPSEHGNMQETYTIRKKKKPHDNMDPNKLANIHRDIVKNKRLTAAELEEIKREIHAERNDRTTSNEEQAEVAISPELYCEWFNESGDKQTFFGFDNTEQRDTEP